MPEGSGGWLRDAALDRVRCRRQPPRRATRGGTGSSPLAASSIQLGTPQADSLAQSGPSHAGLEQLEGSGIGTGALSPFDSLVRAGDPDKVADTLARACRASAERWLLKRGVTAAAHWSR